MIVRNRYREMQLLVISPLHVALCRPKEEAAASKRTPNRNRQYNDNDDNRHPITDGKQRKVRDSTCCIGSSDANQIDQGKIV